MPAALKLRVQGMDCGACAIKIENGLQRLPGVSEINVNVGLETLSLVLDEDRTSRAAVEQRIRSLGYTPHPIEDGRADRATHAQPESRHRPWWRTNKGRFAIGTAALLSLAFVIAWMAPE